MESKSFVGDLDKNKIDKVLFVVNTKTTPKFFSESVATLMNKKPISNDTKSKR